MPWHVELAQHLIRTLHLLALAIAPTWLSPDPVAPRALAVAASSAGGLALVLGISARFAAHLGSRLARNGAALLWVAVAAALAASFYYQGPRAPLALGAPLVAVPLWAALATLAAAAAEQWLGSSIKHKRMAAAILVLGVGAKQLIGAAELLRSNDRMWWAALRRDGEHVRAVRELTHPALARGKFEEAERVAARCLRMHPLPAAGAVAPATCACLAVRAEVRLRTQDPGGALRDAETTRTQCPDQREIQPVLAEALALTGQLDRAETEALAALDAGGDVARLRYSLALVYERRGSLEAAREELAHAIDAGAGRDAKLLDGALAILAGDLERAAARLEPLVKEDPDDAPVLYNVALIADRRGDYNGARQGYLAALKADPKSADARYNLALLTFRAGVVEESRHHVRKFLDTFPADPRGEQLARATGTSVEALRERAGTDRGSGGRGFGAAPPSQEPRSSRR